MPAAKASATALTTASCPTGKRGRLWDSTRRRRSAHAGRLVHSLYLGRQPVGRPVLVSPTATRAGIPSNTTPAIEVRRDNARSTDLVFNFISAPVTLHGSRTITFAFQATPVKPIQPGWRMDTWWTGDSFNDWAQVESEGHAGDDGPDLQLDPVPAGPRQE